MIYYKYFNGHRIGLVESNNDLPEGAEVITEQEYNTLYQLQLKHKRFASLETQINRCKRYLSQTDYQAIKYAEGLLTAEEYEPIKQQRQAWRDQINQLEEELNEE